MANEKINIADKQYMAKVLFTREGLEQKIIAKKVGVTEKTISKWVNDFNWKDLKRRLLLSKEEQLNSLYMQLEKLNEAINNSEAKHGDSKQADILIKYTTAIKNLETDLAIADLVEAGIRLIKFVQRTKSVEEAVKITDTWHAFLQSVIKNK